MLFVLTLHNQILSFVVPDLGYCVKKEK